MTADFPGSESRRPCKNRGPSSPHGGAFFPLSRARPYPQIVRLDTGAVLAASRGRLFEVPKGPSRIAQRFNAGLDAKRSGVPKGRLRSNPPLHHSAVPSGLVCQAGCFPALKRRAILMMSLRDKGKATLGFSANQGTKFLRDAFNRFSPAPRCPAGKMLDTLSSSVRAGVSVHLTSMQHPIESGASRVLRVCS